MPSPGPSRSNSREPLYRTTSLETRSRTPSPHQTQTPTPAHEYYGSANLTDRSRSPSPTPGHGTRGAPSAAGAPKRPGRKLPATPQKPSTLNLDRSGKQARKAENFPHVLPSPTIPAPHKSPGSINFPKLNASPSHLPRMNIPSSRTESSIVRPRPLAISPTDQTNDLNQPSSHHPPLGGSSREQIVTRAGSHDRLLDDARLRDNRLHDNRLDGSRGVPRYPGPAILNNSRADPRGFSGEPRDSRDQNRGGGGGFLDEADLVRGPPPPRGSSRQQHSSNTLPNGFKPGQHKSGQAKQRGERTKAKKPAKQRHSDSDDEDWC